jgi:hypothetical protein
MMVYHRGTAVGAAGSGQRVRDEQTILRMKKRNEALPGS